MSGRIRTLKPEWLEDEVLASCDDATRLLSVGLILLADDYGNGRAAEMYIAGQVWCYGENAAECVGKVQESLRTLSGKKFIDLYSVNGQRYFSICNWERHQKVQRPGKPHVPGPECADQSATVSGECPESVRIVSGLTYDLRPTTNDRSSGDEGLRSPDGRMRFDFEAVYARYPKKTGKAKAMAKLPKIIRTRDQFELFRRCVEAMADGWRGHDTQFCPGFLAFTNGKRWEDDEWPMPLGVTGELFARSGEPGRDADGCFATPGEDYSMPPGVSR